MQQSNLESFPQFSEARKYNALVFRFHFFSLTAFNKIQSIFHCVLDIIREWNVERAMKGRGMQGKLSKDVKLMKIRNR